MSFFREADCQEGFFFRFAIAKINLQNAQVDASARLVFRADVNGSNVTFASGPLAVLPGRLASLEVSVQVMSPPRG